MASGRVDFGTVRARQNATSRMYREYCEEAVRDGLKDSPFTGVLQQVCLGGQEFLKEVLAESEPSIGKERYDVEQVKTAMEQVRGERWNEFVNRHGD